MMLTTKEYELLLASFADRKEKIKTVQSDPRVSEAYKKLLDLDFILMESIKHKLRPS